MFVRPTVDHIVYLRGERVHNNPVNINKVTSISKGRFSWYPDNKGRPTIRFFGAKAEWVYDNATDRDADFERIANNEFLQDGE